MAVLTQLAWPLALPVVQDIPPAGIDPSWAAPCGMCCRLCEFFDSASGLTCGGCLQERLCRVDEEQCWFVGCTDRHEVEHCGLCDAFPCNELYEHQVCGDEIPEVAVFRIGDLALRARMGTVGWLRAKLDGTLPEAWHMRAKAGLGSKSERRRYRRSEKSWLVTVSFLPASLAFGLSNIQTQCANASPIGMGLSLPESARDGFLALTRTKRNIEVVGEFPTTHGSHPFSGRVVWHNVKGAEAGEDLRVGVLFDTVGNEGVEI